ncbi:flagellar export chaperone FlgN [Paucibacter sp. PLA-PC-4]|uniref:flagellar export chaperone FlgN n=1 Tax=Paucibacter sp. PLA-PC-4 TaxID=2993655 RepID=UPI002248A728|nr:flagellar export chaperone FlgN [Paucibacter sp. PLA-PC-4]MCX2861695.1 flagellar export chaperone FlgN [Paucibacter sp. PLA-PC-4]
MSKVAEVLARLLRDLHADRSAYARLRELLEEQFQAALRHRSEQLSALAADIVALVEQLDQRRAVRSELLLALLGRNSKPSVEALLQRLSGASAQTLAAAWQGLEQQVTECKALNLRNCQLITDQHALMLRVLGVEEVTYAEY